MQIPCDGRNSLNRRTDVGADKFLDKKQANRPLDEAIAGEDLNILVGSRPLGGDDSSDAVKLNILNILYEKYGFVEADFLSAELSLVPAFKARDIGFDRGLIGAYGHDDRVCSYPALTALLDAADTKRTAMVVLADKEEVGSDGNTGLNSAYLKYFIYDLADMDGVKGRDVLSKSKCLSADVNAAFDPTFPDVMERRNASFLNYGVVVTKYTGARGKGGTSDASAEYVAFVRNMLDKAGITWQRVSSSFTSLSIMLLSA